MKRYEFSEPLEPRIEEKAQAIGKEFKRAGLEGKEIENWVERGKQEEGAIAAPAHKGTLKKLRLSREMIHFKLSVALEAVKYLIERGIIEKELPAGQILAYLEAIAKAEDASDFTKEDKERLMQAVYNFTYLKKQDLLPEDLTAFELPAYLKAQLSHYE